MHWSILALLEAAWIVFISVWIILERRSQAGTLAWIFGLALLPILGALVYYFLGPRRLRRKQVRRSMARKAIASWTGGRRLSDFELPRPADPRHRRIAEVSIRAGEAPPLPVEELTLFTDGDRCFDALIEAVHSARHHVHLEYYTLNPGELGLRLAAALIEKAREGVEVRLLADAFGSHRLHKEFLAPLRAAGVEIAFFNSFRFAGFWLRLANFRTHRKIVVVDGRLALTGGMNIMDEHSVALRGEAAWRDTHLLLSGAAVLPLQLVFLEDWHFATSTAPVGESYVLRPQLPEGGPFVQIVASGPDQEIRSIHSAYFAALGQAERRALITTPYFVPDEAMLAAITGAAYRGVDVRLLVPCRPGHVLVQAAARTFHGALLAAGVRVFEYTKGMIHAKTLVVDDDVSIVGSANLDNRSFQLNFEVVAVIFGEETARGLAAQFEEDILQAEEVTVDRGLGDSILERVAAGMARLFSPLL